MADNTTLPGTGDIIAADDVGGAKHQQVKIEFGANGTATPVDASNPLPVTAELTGTQNNYFLEALRGNVSGASAIAGFGSSSAIGTSLTVIASAQTYQTPVANTALEMVSSDNTNDIPAGSGARKVTVYGIVDTAGVWAEASEEVTLNGTTAVALATSFIRVHNMEVTEAGGYATVAVASHSSTITLRVAGAGATWATIIPDGTFGLGQSATGAYSIPSSKVGYVLVTSIAVEATKPATVVMFSRENANDYATPYSGVMRLHPIGYGIADVIQRAAEIPRGPFTGPCDIGFLGKLATGTGGVAVSFEIILFDV